jgi:hypothetical protein
MNEIIFYKTNRNYTRGDFLDVTGTKCSIQESSSVINANLWLGVDGDRMHLNRELAANLIPLLQNFVDGDESLDVLQG